VSADTSAEASAASPEESAWSWHADWTEPVRRHRVPVLLAGTVVLGLLAWRIGLRADLLAFAYLGCAGTVLGVVDISMRRLPDPLTLPSYPIGMALLGAAVPFTPDGGDRFVDALIGLGALWVLFAVQWFLVPRGFGLGDVKLSGVLGLYLGWLGYEAWVLGVFSTFLLGGVYALALLVLRRAGRRSTIPFGPFMLAGALVGTLVHA
jgi:leader peptidase (prepilin peptidase)/N-methyltransferase